MELLDKKFIIEIDNSEVEFLKFCLELVYPTLTINTNNPDYQKNINHFAVIHNKLIAMEQGEI